jgi:hypothetical protein
MAEAPPPPSPTTERAWQLFTRGYALESAGRFDDAFEAFAEANRWKRSEFDAEAHVASHEAGVKELRRIFTRDFLTSHQTRNPLRSPIFIVGMPRSGSTLVEQILATHPKVQGMGESNHFAKISRRYFPFGLGPTDPEKMAVEYLKAMHGAGWKSSARFTDKTLLHYPSIGLLHMMFPKATILNMVREPVDTLFSCYRQMFSDWTDTRFTYDLGHLGRQYVAYREMMNHWDTVLPGRVLNVNHEALVANGDRGIRDVVEACDLPWDDRCLRFFENKRTVHTASKDQVRRPIFTESLGRWRCYERHLGPLFTALGPFAPRL